MSTEQTVFDNTSGDNQPKQENQPAANSDKQNYYEQLVGEGRKFKSVEDLAKGKLESDKFIDSLEKQLEELRKELEKRESAEEVAKRLRDELREQPAASDNTPSDWSEERVAAIVQSTITDLERKNTTRQNVMTADKKFKEVHGDKASIVLAERASELGLTVEQLGDIAAKSPSAFFKMVGLDKPEASGTSKTTVPVKGSVNTEALKTVSSSLKPGSKAYWDAQRKEMGAKFWSPDIQREIFKCKQDGRYDAA